MTVSLELETINAALAALARGARTFDEDERGYLKRDTTEVRKARMLKRRAYLLRRIEAVATK